MFKNQMLGNNIKALVIHAIITLMINVFFYTPDSYSLTLNIAIGSLLYVVLSAVLLKPTKRLFYSVISVFVLLMFIAIIESFGEYFGMISMMFNPCYIEFIYDMTNYNSFISVYVSTIIPSLLMFIGLIIKKIIYRHFDKNESINEKHI